MTVVNPVHAAEISKAFSDYDAAINSEPRHPTLTTKGSVWVMHADGTRSHWQVRRPMSMREAKRKERLEQVAVAREKLRKAQLPLARFAAWVDRCFKVFKINS